MKLDFNSQAGEVMVSVRSVEQPQNAQSQGPAKVEKYPAKENDCGNETDDHEQLSHLWVVLQIPPIIGCNRHKG